MWVGIIIRQLLFCVCVCVCEWVFWGDAMQNIHTLVLIQYLPIISFQTKFIGIWLLEYLKSFCSVE